MTFSMAVVRPPLVAPWWPASQQPSQRLRLQPRAQLRLSRLVSLVVLAQLVVLAAQPELVSPVVLLPLPLLLAT